MNRRLTRREAILAAASGGLIVNRRATGSNLLDRKKIVQRHNPRVTSVDVHSALQVGNGEFAFAMDVTGLQTFQEEYRKGMPLGTMAQWAWHSFPNTGDYKLGDVLKSYDAHGRDVSYPVGVGELRIAGQTLPEKTAAAASWLVGNPHRIHLARLSLVLPGEANVAIHSDAVSNIEQRLNLWTGLVESRFQLLGVPVRVETVCHPQRNTLAVGISSSLLADGRLGHQLAFPYASTSWAVGYDWNSSDKYETKLSRRQSGGLFESTLDESRYWSNAQWSTAKELRMVKPHEFHVTANGQDQLEFAIEFSPEKPLLSALSFSDVKAQSETHWNEFWQRGGAIDFSDCTDERAPELERRVVLSQYVTAVNCAGSMPPQETGLVTNSWSGKSHLEMHWWHAAHFVLWGRPDLLERSLPWYEKILPQAVETAKKQGYRGARWPKEVGPEARETPDSVGPFLIWQPHPIYYSELIYSLHPTRSALESYKQLVFETAEFMASYAVQDGPSRTYVLGPPLIPAQETYSNLRANVINPTFELAYWHWGLSVAQRWRERLGMQRKESWDAVINNLSPPPIRNGIYAAIAIEPYTLYTDHPSMLCALGMLPKTPVVDPSIMARSLDDVLATWNWKSAWGWDYPVVAMTAARLGQPETAVDALLMQGPKNAYLPNGFNVGMPGLLPLYLPDNGGLLYATAMMAAGWKGSTGKAPGFPRNGKWNVKGEGLNAAL